MDLDIETSSLQRMKLDVRFLFATLLNAKYQPQTTKSF